MSLLLDALKLGAQKSEQADINDDTPSGEAIDRHDVDKLSNSEEQTAVNDEFFEDAELELSPELLNNALESLELVDFDENSDQSLMKTEDLIFSDLGFASNDEKLSDDTAILSHSDNEELSQQFKDLPSFGLDKQDDVDSQPVANSLDESLKQDLDELSTSESVEIVESVESVESVLDDIPQLTSSDEYVESVAAPIPEVVDETSKKDSPTTTEWSEDDMAFANAQPKVDENQTNTPQKIESPEALIASIANNEAYDCTGILDQLEVKQKQRKQLTVALGAGIAVIILAFITGTGSFISNNNPEYVTTATFTLPVASSNDEPLRMIDLATEVAARKVAPKTIEKLKDKPKSKVKQSNNKPTSTLKVKTRQADPTMTIAGHNALRAGDLEGAKKLFRKALADNVNSIDAIVGLGAIYYQQGLLNNARAHFRRALNINPNNAYALASLANMLSKDAGTELKSTLLGLSEKYPNSSQLHFMLGNALAKEQQWQQAQSAYFNAFQKDQKNANYSLNLAIALDHLGKSQAAIKFYKDALALSAASNTQINVDMLNQRLTELELLQ